MSHHARLPLAGVVFAAIAVLVAMDAPAATAAACTGPMAITRISGGEFDIDTGISPQLTGSYAGYRVSNDTTPVDDLWVKATNFVGGTVSLGLREDGLVHIGPVGPSAESYAYFYLAANGAATGQTHDTSSTMADPEWAV